jgi:hypothetical protein
MKVQLKKSLAAGTAALAALTSSASMVSAQEFLNDITIAKPAGFADNASGLINSVLTIVMVVAALLVFFYLIWGGIEWITSGGDKGQTEKARNKITAAVIGLIILAASYAILNLALSFLGFSGLDDVFRSANTLDDTHVNAGPGGRN